MSCGGRCKVMSCAGRCKVMSCGGRYKVMSCAGRCKVMSCAGRCWAVQGYVLWWAVKRLCPVLGGARLCPVLGGKRLCPVVGGVRLCPVLGGESYVLCWVVKVNLAHSQRPFPDKPRVSVQRIVRHWGAETKTCRVSTTYTLETQVTQHISSMCRASPHMEYNYKLGRGRLFRPTSAALPARYFLVSD